jgi:L-lactate dehydrogenase
MKQTGEQTTATAPARYRADDLLAFGIALMKGGGLADDRARDVAEILHEADLLGHTTHGFAQMAPYLKDLEAGQMSSTGEPVVVSDRGAALTWDGQYLPGAWLVRRAIAEAQARIAQHPVVTVVINRSHHIGCLQAYLKPVTDAGYVLLLTCSDPAVQLVTPHGGTAPRYTPNPIAAGFPTDGDPVLIDVSMSTTNFALVKRTAAADGKMAGPWLVDPQGNATDDPAVMMQEPRGAILPLGGLDLGHKGYALALLVEALTSGLAGHGRADEPRRWGGSVFVQILDPEAFGGRDAFKRQMTHLAALCHDTPVPEGKPPVRLPGEGAIARRARQVRDGVALFPKALPMLTPYAERYGVALPQPIA